MANDPHDSHGPSLLAVASRFERAFGRTPTSIAFAPGRVNLIGEHVDYAEGVVLPIAIERGTAVAAAPTPIVVTPPPVEDPASAELLKRMDEDRARSKAVRDAGLEKLERRLGKVGKPQHDPTKW